MDFSRLGCCSDFFFFVGLSDAGAGCDLLYAGIFCARGGGMRCALRGFIKSCEELGRRFYAVSGG